MLILKKNSLELIACNLNGIDFFASVTLLGCFCTPVFQFETIGKVNPVWNFSLLFLVSIFSAFSLLTLG